MFQDIRQLYQSTNKCLFASVVCEIVHLTSNVGPMVETINSQQNLGHTPDTSESVPHACMCLYVCVCVRVLTTQVLFLEPQTL